MKRSVLVALADKQYLEPARQLFSVAFWNAGWRGDYLLLAHETSNSDTVWFSRKGIIVKHCKALPCKSEKKGDIITASKCYLLSKYFKQWEHVIYLDVDILIRAPIDGLLDVERFGAVPSLGQTIKDNLIDLKRIDDTLLSELKRNYDLNADAFNSGVMSFNTAIIEDNSFDEIRSLFNKYVKTGSFGGDQLPFNLYFYNKWIAVPAVYNRIVEMRDERKTNAKNVDGIIIHLVSFGDGPWRSTSAFHEEWRHNLDRADAMDLQNVPNIQGWSQKKICQQSNKIRREYLVGQEPTIAGAIQFIVRGCRLMIRNPLRAIVKAKQILGLLMRKS